jgi:hypothetical protein
MRIEHLNICSSVQMYFNKLSVSCQAFQYKKFKCFQISASFHLLTDVLIEVKFSYYDYKACKDVEISQEQAMDMDIFYIYIQNGFLYIAVNNLHD